MKFATIVSALVAFVPLFALGDVDGLRAVDTVQDESNEDLFNAAEPADLFQSMYQDLAALADGEQETIEEFRHHTEEFLHGLMHDHGQLGRNLGVAGKPAPDCKGYHECDCFTCGDVTEKDDGTLDISINHCKDGSISWICCTAVDGKEGSCDVVTDGCDAAPKCNGMDSGEFTVNVPKDSKSFTINTHDGKTAGDANIQSEICGGKGNQGGSCANDFYTAHCLVDIDIEKDCKYTPGPGSDPEPNPAPDSEPDSEPKQEPEPETVSEPEPETETESEPKKSEPEPETETESDPKKAEKKKTKKAEKKKTKKAGMMKTKKAGMMKTKKAGMMKTKKAGMMKTKKAGMMKTKKAGMVKTKKAGMVKTKKAEKEKKKAEKMENKSEKKAKKEKKKAEKMENKSEKKAKKEKKKAEKMENKSEKKSEKKAEKKAKKDKKMEKKSEKKAEKKAKKDKKMEKKSEKKAEKKDKKDKKMEKKKKDMKMKNMKKKLPPNCKTSRVKKEIACPAPTPPKLPRKCTGVSASWSGDPHFKTFDKVKYDCMGEGEFVVAKSVDEQFSLQGRFVKFNEKRRPTVTKAVALDTGDGEPKIQINVPDKDAATCAPYVFIAGKKTEIEGTKTIDHIQIKKTKSKKEDGYVFFYENTGVQLVVGAKKSSANGCVLRAEICVPDCYHRMTAMGGEGFTGMLGTPDGDKSNDWPSKTGESIPMKPKNSKAEYKFCTENWCIQDEAKSLFVYEGDETFDKINQCDLGPDLDTDKCVADPTSVTDMGKDFGTQLLDTCAAGDAPCLVDGCTGGVSSARQYVQASLNQVDKNCGKLIFKENFNKEDASKYGQILTKAKVKANKKFGSHAAETNFLSLNKDSPSVKIPFDIPAETVQVSVEFLFYEIGDWEKKGGCGADRVFVTIGDKQICLGSFNGNKNDKNANGATAGIAWSRTMLTKSADLGFTAVGGDKKDQIHKYVLQIPDEFFPSGVLNFALDVAMDDMSESAGINDMKVYAFKSSCSIDCTGTSVVREDFENDDDSDWGVVGELGDHPYLGPLKDSVSVAKAFDVSPYADRAQVDFTLYTIGDWTDKGTAVITVGGLAFDLGEFKEEELGLITNGQAGDAVAEEGLKKERDTSTIFWQRKPTALNSDVLTEGGEDGVHDVRFMVPSDYIIDGQLTVGFSVDGSVTAGIDNFEILVFPEPKKCSEAKKEEQDNKKTCPNGASTGGGGKDGDKGKAKKCFKNVRETVCTPTMAPSPVPDTPTTPTAPSTPTVPTTPTVPAPTPTGDRSGAPVTKSPKTKPPTPAPTNAPSPSGATGDPHIFKWNGESYDFHGECDLVLLQNPDFNNGQGMHVHIRTKIHRWWSYIDSAAVKIGDDVFEAKSGITLEDRKYWVNGVEQHHFRTSRNFNFTIGGFGGRFRAMNDHVIQYKFYLPDEQYLMIRSVKDMLRVEVQQPLAQDFHTGRGLMGKFGSGDLIGRDDQTLFEDPNAFGQEWQVGPNDPQIFHDTTNTVQYPQQCKMPLQERTQRRLGGSISRETAEKACARVNRAEFEDCVFDVMATNDVDAVESY